ncbi:MAG TPA: hypothetical protein VII11_05890 [Bacteroidota bacterium]
MKKYTHSLSALVMAVVIVSALFSACGEDEATQSGENVCTKLTVSDNQPAININCNSLSGSVSNIQYDGFGRVESMEFDWRCNTSSERYTGRFYNIQRNGIGQIQSYQATVNGKNCNWSK